MNHSFLPFYLLSEKQSKIINELAKKFFPTDNRNKKFCGYIQVILNQQATDITDGLQQVKFYLDNDLIQTRERFLLYPLSVSTKNQKMIFKQKSKQFELFENAHRRCVQQITEKNCNYLQRNFSTTQQWT